MGKESHEKHPFTSALQLFGVIRIWASIAIGLLVVVGCAAVFVLSYTWDAGFVATTGVVAHVDCGPVQKSSECRRSGSQSTCITTESVECEVEVRYDDERSATFQLQYEDGFEPSVGDRFPLFFDRNDPQRVAQHKFSEAQRTVARVLSALMGTIALVVVVINAVLANSKSFHTLQGGLGALSALGKAL